MVFKNLCNCVLWTKVASALKHLIWHVFNTSMYFLCSLFDLESDPFCNLDYVEVREGDNRGALFGRFCGSEISTNMTLGHSLWVKFRSSSRTSGQGFMAQYASGKFLLGIQYRHLIPAPDICHCLVVQTHMDNNIPNNKSKLRSVGIHASMSTKFGCNQVCGHALCPGI